MSGKSIRYMYLFDFVSNALEMCVISTFATERKKARGIDCRLYRRKKFNLFYIIDHEQSLILQEIFNEIKNSFQIHLQRFQTI